MSMLRWVMWMALGLAALAFVGFTGWLFFLPDTARVEPASPLPNEEQQRLVDALKPTRSGRPLIAIVGINDATEMADYLMPLGILRRADVATVIPLGARPGPLTLFPAALKVEPEATLIEFDTKFPAGANYVIVPAMSRDDDPAVLEWLKQQANKGATIIGACVGVKVVAAAGLLDGKRATTHWYVRKELLKKHPSIQYVPNRRIVADNGVVTTTGITASIPLCLTLIEAIAGREEATSIAHNVGLAQWDARHRSAAFRFTRRFALTALRNRLAFWTHEELAVKLTSELDEVSLALVADAWSRTYRSHAVTVAKEPVIQTKTGLRLLPSRVTACFPEQPLAQLDDEPAVRLLDRALATIERRYDRPTADFVAMQLEYLRAEPAH